MEINERASEIARFTGLPESDCMARLQLGFHPLHAAVAEDFHSANPKNDTELLNWYRTTTSYIWELTAYHLDPGFNYSGMCNGVAGRLLAAGAKNVLVLGDGIGDLTLALLRAGMAAVYHDLAGSRTAGFAEMRLVAHSSEFTEPARFMLTAGWLPLFVNVERGTFDAICSFDFMEHLPNVEEWVREIKRMLKPGGLFCAQNAFACGSGPDGSIPMHLAENDRFERDWDPLLFSLGFTQENSNWYINETPEAPLLLGHAPDCGKPGAAI